jgi:hypothetical protein
MFAKRIGDESLGATPRAMGAFDAAAVGERLPLLHREGQAPDALASTRGRKSRSTAVSIAAVGGALAMVVVCGVALANSATGAKHANELARADAAGVPASAGRLGAHARRVERRERRRARRVSLDPNAAGTLGADAQEAAVETPEEEEEEKGMAAVGEAEEAPVAEAEALGVTAEAPEAAEAVDEEDAEAPGPSEEPEAAVAEAPEAEAEEAVAEAPVAGAEEDLFAEAPEAGADGDLFADAPEPQETPDENVFADAPEPSPEASDLFADAPGPSLWPEESGLFADAPGPSEPFTEEDTLDPYAFSPSGAVPFDPSANHVADQKVFADDEFGNHTGTPGRLYLAPQDPWDTEESRRRTAHGVLTPARADRAETGREEGEKQSAPDESRAALAAAARRARAARHERAVDDERGWTI